MPGYSGDIALAQTIDIGFTTTSATTGAATVLAGSPVISAYVGNSVTQITAGITLSVDFDGIVGYNNVRVVATTGNGYAAQTDVRLVITTGTVGGTSAVGYEVGSFSIENRAAIRPTVAGRTLDVSATGEAGIDWANIGSPTTAVNLSATNIDVDQVVASVSGAVGSVTAAVSLTGDLTATMKTSVTTAATAATPTAAAVTGAVGSVTGAVGSVTGNVGGNVAGSVASVTAAVSITGDLSATMKTSVTTAATAATPTAAAVTGAVGSVTGNVGGNVAGSVGSVVGAVASVTGAVGSVTGAVGSVTGAVGSVTGNVGGNVAGSVGSVTVVTDKTGYRLDATGSAALAESYAADGTAATLPQLLYMTLALLSEFSIAGTTLTAKKLDGSTTAGTFTLDDATNPTSITRAT